MSDTDTEGNHSLVVLDCRECDEADVLTRLEHPKDSQQHRIVADGHDTVAAEHHEDTGHNVDLKSHGGSPDEILELARELAGEIEGVPDDAFHEELVA